MRRRDFLIGAGAMALSAAGGPLLFNRRGRAFADGSPLDGLIPFNGCDTLENIRAIIKHNDFRFQVGHTFAYDYAGYAATQADVEPKIVDSIIIPPAPVPPDPTLPSKFDLRDINGRSYIGPIREQGQSNICYDFAACVAAEATYNRHHDLYDDNCISLSPAYLQYAGNYGSESELGVYYGLTRSGLPWGKPTGLEGVCREEDFPFTVINYGGVTPPSVQIETAKAAPRITFRRCGQVYPHNYWETINRIKRAIYNYGAVGAGFLNCSALAAYKSGVYEDTWIYPDNLPYYTSSGNHAIALIGWDDNPPEGGNGGCWIVRNTFGSDWGEGGYARIRYFSAHINCFAAFLEAESPDDGALCIYGTIKVDGLLYAGATITLSGDDSFETVAYGQYGFPTLKPGRYRVTPTQTGVVFTPRYQEVVLTDITPPAVLDFTGVTTPT